MSKRSLVGLAAVGVLLVVAAGALFPAAADVPECVDGGMLALQLSGTEEQAQEVLRGCAEAERDDIRDALEADDLFLVLYGATIVYWCALALWARALRTSLGGAATFGAALAAVLAAAFDAVENLALARLVAADGSSDGYAGLALAAAVPKWVLVTFAATVGTGAALRVAGRLLAPAPKGDSPLWLPPGDDVFTRAGALPSTDPGEVGIALSGGGIRSASFCMGALQVLDEESWPADGPSGGGDGADDPGSDGGTPGGDATIVRRSRWITAVSGGGYLAGARQLLVHQGVDDAFAAGSYEVDHVRRHGRYLAESVGEWLLALGRVLAGLLLNLGVLWLLLFAAARPVGWFHRIVFDVPPTEGVAIDYSFTPGVWGAVALPAALALALVVVAVLWRSAADASVRLSAGGVLWRAAAVTGAAAVGAAAFTVLVPLVAAGLDALVDEVSDRAAAGREVATAGGAGILATLLTLARIKAPSRRTVERWLRRGGSSGDADGDSDSPSGPRPARFPRLGRAVRALAGAVLVVLVLVLFAGIVQDGSRAGPAGDATFGAAAVTDWHLWAGALGVLTLLFLFADQTSWSLHPLYKRRLATAFAIRRGDGRAEELDYEAPTTLSEYARHRPERRQPELVVCAAANVSGPDVAPPGRRSVSYTFGGDWVGSPALGYVPTETFERSLRGPHRGDTTLLAAMAVSGAAFASAMGRHSKGSLNTLLAVTNLRLGVWLPTPRQAADVEVRTVRRVRSRGASYLLREIFGVYDPDDPFVYVSDGGHYENLGLVELLRRRCRHVLCCDASGGPGTLLEALNLAREELGVRVDLPPGALDSVRAPYERETAGGEEDTEADVDPLLARTAPSSVIVAPIAYPDGSEGLLVYGRAVLTPDVPEPVLHHARREVRFPNGPTGDQWFDVEQFNHYLLLGRHVGARMVVALRDALATVPATT